MPTRLRLASCATRGENPTPAPARASGSSGRACSSPENMKPPIGSRIGRRRRSAAKRRGRPRAAVTARDQRADPGSHRLVAGRRRARPPPARRGGDSGAIGSTAAPGLDLLARAVGVGVGRRMADVAVALDVEQRRALAPRPAAPRLRADRVQHRQRVGAVDRLGVQGFRVEAGADARQPVPAHGLARRSARPWRRSCC